MRLEEHIGKTGGAPAGLFNHKEAFCLMLYACGDTHHQSMVWNSRDGVTPLAINCPHVSPLKCDQEATHIDWGRDTFRPDLVPQPGMLVFVDFPDCLADAYARKRVEQFRGTEHYPKSVDEKQRLITRLTESMKKDSAPYLIRIP